MEKFVNEMKAKGHEVEVVSATKHFLPTTTKRIIIGEEAITIYLYKSNSAMERNAKRISPAGNMYIGVFKSALVEWVAKPHFYKKDNIIVQYIGYNERIISDLNDIFGEQFAGQ